MKAKMKDVISSKLNDLKKNLNIEDVEK